MQNNRMGTFFCDFFLGLFLGEDGPGKGVLHPKAMVRSTCMGGEGIPYNWWGLSTQK